MKALAEPSAEASGERSAQYASYLLRLRWALRNDRPVCQAMLTSVTSKEQRYFADLESMVTYLAAQGPRARGAIVNSNQDQEMPPLEQ
jgi:hypothetical protein